MPAGETAVLDPDDRWAYRDNTLRAVGRYRERASVRLQWGIRYRAADIGRDALHELKWRPHEAKVARVERCHLPVEVPAEPALLALR